jgi:hypothetical protein
MKKVTFFVEGKADKKFISDYLISIGIEKVNDIQFVLIDSNTEAAIQNRKVDFERSTAKGNINLLIFDADGNKSTTEIELQRIKTKLSIDFEIFLFPNNSDQGNLEILLEQIINAKHQPIFDCFESYQQCLGLKSSEYKVPATKTKIYAFVDTLVSKNDEKFAKEENRDYLNTNHWDLTLNYLTPLKSFLLSYIK